MWPGDAGDNFYVVESGDFDIFVNGNRVASRGPGTSFGELALLYNSPRAATVTSTKPCVLWALDRHTFRHMLASSREFHLDTVISALRNVPLLRSLTAEQMDKIADAVQVRGSGSTLPPLLLSCGLDSCREIPGHVLQAWRHHHPKR